MRTAARGITLLELVFALGLLALLAGLAIPGWRTSLRVAAVRSATFELLAGLQQTRANSILEARAGAFCATDPAGACLPSSAPGTGWQSTLEGALEPGVAHSLPASVQLRSSRSPIRFWPHGLAATTGTLTICDAQGLARPRAIIISQTGRARLADAPAEACP
jgi:type IV fimbrial biogenesis protein FimT